MWILETSGAYVYIKNRNTGLYIDGRGISTNGAYAGQWSGSTSNNLQWSQENVGGGYVKFKNRATGLYLDGMGNATNGADLGQWANSNSNNQQWTITTVSSGARLSTVAAAPTEEPLTAYPNPVMGRITINLPADMKAAAIKVINASGHVLMDEKASSATHVLDMTHLPTGLYLIKANEGMKSRTLKVLKE